MNSDEVKSPKIKASSSFNNGWQRRITIPTILAGLAGGTFGLVSKSKRPLAANYAANFAVITGCYCGMRELARDARASEPDDLFNSVIGGVASGALLGRLQGGQLGAIRYALVFSTVGTAVDYTTLKLRPHLRVMKNTAEEMWSDSSLWKVPEWSPIQILDEEALAAKKAKEDKLHAMRRYGKTE